MCGRMIGFLHSLLAPLPSGSLDIYPVPTLVNSVRNDGPELIARLPIDPAADPRQPTLFG